MKGHLKKGGVLLVIIAAIAIIVLCSMGYKAYWNSIGTEEALHGTDHAPAEMILAAREHIKNKYGISARAISSRSNYEWEGFDFIIPHKDYSGTYSIEMEYEDKRFNIYIDADGEIRDDYQSDEIKAWLQEYISAFLPACEVDSSFSLLHEYIDTESMAPEEFLDAHYTYIKIYVVKMDLKDRRFDEIKEFAESVKAHVVLTSCRSEQDRDTLMEMGAPGVGGNYAQPTQYAMQAESIWYCTYSSLTDCHEEDDYTFRLGQYGDLRYTIPDSSIEITDYDADTYEAYGKVYDLLTPAYQVKCEDTVTLFYPAALAEPAELANGETFMTYGSAYKEVRRFGGYYVCTFPSEKWYDDHSMSVYYDKEKIYGIYVGS